MTVGSIGTSSFDLEAIRSRFQQFEQGKGNLSKNDLSQIQSQSKIAGGNATDPLQAILDNFDEIDSNGDGISLDELRTFAETNKLSVPDGGGMSAHRPDGPPPKPKDLTKDDLEQMISEITSRNGQAPSELQGMLDSFDSVDADQDGTIRPEEFGAYLSSQGVAAPSGNMPPMEKRPAPESNTNESAAGSEAKTADSEVSTLIRLIEKKILAAYAAYSSSDTSSPQLADVKA